MIVRRLDGDYDMMFGHSMGDYLGNGEAIAQNVKSRLLLFKGEWFLDVNAGTPWDQVLGVKPMDPVTTENVIRAAILGTEGVTGIVSFTLVFDPNTRKGTVNVTVSTIYSTTVTVEVPIP